MEKKHLFSIITVVYNDAENLEKTIKSLLAQSYKGFEYIVIDGGSNDNTLDVVNRYKEQIDYFVSEPDKGIYDAMNKGIKAANGKFINFLNAGDIFYSAASLHLVSRTAYQYTQTEIFYGQALRISSEKSRLKFIKGGIITPSNLFTSIPFCHQAIFYSTSLFEEIGLYDASYKVTADYQWLIRYYNKRKNLKKMLFLENKLVEYLEGGFSFKNIRIAAKEKLRIALKDFKMSKKAMGLIVFSAFYLKVFGIKWMVDFQLLDKYRSIKYRLLNKNATTLGVGD